jgi:capsid protein
MNIFGKIKQRFSAEEPALEAAPAVIEAAAAVPVIEASEAAPVVGRRIVSYGGQKWSRGLANPWPRMEIDPEGMRRQVRYLSHQSTQAASLINSDVNTIIDSGLTIKPEPLASVLGISEDAAKEWAADVKSRFDLWAQSREASKCGRYNFYQAQRLLQRCRTRDGESFLLHNYSGAAELINPLQIEIIDPDQIAEQGYISTVYNGNAVSDGIIRDNNGRETGYKVWYKDAATKLPVMRTIPREKGGRVFMTHGMNEQEYAGQSRGFSALGVSIQDLENILDLALAQIKKGINQSNIYMTGNGGDPFGKLDSGGVGIVEETGGAEAETGAGKKPVYTPIPEVEIDRPGSVGIFSLEPGETLTPFPNTAPDVGFAEFTNAYFEYVAAAAGTSSELVRMHFNQNYHSSRATLILCYRVATRRRYLLACDHLDPVYESWIAEEIAAGRVNCPGWREPRLRAAWLRHAWTGSYIRRVSI